MCDLQHKAIHLDAVFVVGVCVFQLMSARFLHVECFILKRPSKTSSSVGQFDDVVLAERNIAHSCELGDLLLSIDVPRHRAPLFIGQVDPERLCVIRDTERILIPKRGANLANFGAAHINEHEPSGTVAEEMWGEARQRRAKGCVFVARVQWDPPNRHVTQP